MGKTGGGELNYVCDVDVIFVAEPRRGRDEDAAPTVGDRAGRRADAGLLGLDRRGHALAGRRGAAARGQARARWCARVGQPRGLLRALGQDVGVPGAAQGLRSAAGDREVGPRPTSTPIRPMVWEAAARENFVEDVQAMRRRVEAARAGRPRRTASSSSGRGGLRDVEFASSCCSSSTAAPTRALRSATTLEALCGAGHVAATSAATTRRPSTRPTGCCAPSSTASSCTGSGAPTSCRPASRPAPARPRRRPAQPTRPRPSSTLWQPRAREVRRMHERLFYRPLLGRRCPAAARPTAR